MQAPSAFECTWENQHDAITQVEACELHNSRNAARSSPLPVPTAYFALDIPTSYSAAELRGPGRSPAMAAYPGSHFATDRTAHGFRGGMGHAER